VVAATRRRTETLIRFNRTARYLPEGELLSDVNWKLLKSVSHFDPSRGDCVYLHFAGRHERTSHVRIKRASKFQPICRVGRSKS